MGNIKLLKEVRDNIILNPKTHNQKTWLCDTSMCIAGHAAIISGKVTVVKDANYGLIMVDDEGEFADASEVGSDVLELTEQEREYLFFCMDNDISIKRMDHVISLWEDDKNLEDVPDEERIAEPEREYYCCEDCG